MLKKLKQARTALAMLNPEEVRKLATQPVHIGLIASAASSYADLEDGLVPAEIAGPEREQVLTQLHRAGDFDAPSKVDLVLYEPGVPLSAGAHYFDPHNSEASARAIVMHREDLGLALARQFPVFRGPVVERVVQAVARENAMFAIATALPNVVPSLIEVPWAFGEFASDTAFLTANQIRMAFLIAAACGQEVGYSHQLSEVLAIAGGAFGWRAIARELAGKIPLGGGLIPKGAIAYAGTFMVGKGLEYYHHSKIHYTPAEREVIYQQAYEHGKTIAHSLAPKN